MEVGIETGKINKMGEKKRIQESPMWDMRIPRIPAAVASGVSGLHLNVDVTFSHSRAVLRI